MNHDIIYGKIISKTNHFLNITSVFLKNDNELLEKMKQALPLTIIVKILERDHLQTISLISKSLTAAAEKYSPLFRRFREIRTIGEAYWKGYNDVLLHFCPEYNSAKGFRDIVNYCVKHNLCESFKKIVHADLNYSTRELIISYNRTTLMSFLAE